MRATQVGGNPGRPGAMSAAMTGFETYVSMERLAEQMGLELVEGDPRKPSARPHGSDYRFLGAPHGRRVAFDLRSRRAGVGKGRIAVELREPAPRFEVCTTDPMSAYFLPPRATSLPCTPSGDVAFDGRWTLRAEDPRVGAAIAPAMRLMPPASARLVCTGRTLELRSAGMGVLAVVDGERLLFVLEEVARALEGRAPLSASLGQAEHAHELRCERCGAPSREVPASVHQSIELRCEHCGARAPAPEHLAPAIRALRVSAAYARWEQRDQALTVQAMQGPDAAFEAFGCFYAAFALLGTGMVVTSGAYRFGAGLLPGWQGTLLGSGLAGAAVVASIALAIAGVGAHRLVLAERKRAKAEADTARRDAAVRPPAFTCARCGGAVAIAGSAVARCAHCGGASMATADRLEDERDRLFDEGARAARRTSVVRAATWARARSDHGAGTALMTSWVVDLVSALRRSWRARGARA